MIHALKQKCEEVALHMSLRKTHEAMITAAVKEFEHRIEPDFNRARDDATWLVNEMRRTSILISGAGQSEAISRAIGKPTKYTMSRQDLAQMLDRETQYGGTVKSRVALEFHRLRDDVKQAFHMSLVMSSTAEQTLERIGRAFPKLAKVKRPKVMTKLVEADKKTPTVEETQRPVNALLISPDDWNSAVEDYLEENILIDRSPTGKLYGVNYDEPATSEDEIRYQWQLENQVTQDFVDSVREGENDAANQNGITDFQWIAIVDSKTDDCCLARDGLTTREIEEKLDAGEDMGDSEESVAPAHFNCRCRMAPMTDDMPEVDPPDFGAAEDWLNEQAEKNR
jgi:hypothetical protein